MKFMNITLILCNIILLANNIEAKTKNDKNNETYNKDEILSETHWKDLGVRENVPNHLSLLSQGKFDENVIDKYDKNYYYPISAGKDIDIFVMDVGFNFTYKEFSNTNERTIQCDFIVEKGEVTKVKSNDECYNEKHLVNFHGSLTSTAAAGLNLGVANKANIHGIVFDVTDFNNVYYALKHIKENKLYRPNKTVFNMSFVYTVDQEKYENGMYGKVQDLITEMSNEGVIFVAGAGNNGVYSENKITERKVVPCTFDDVICVGGINNMDQSKGGMILPDIMFKNDPSKREAYSNYDIVSKYEVVVKDVAVENMELTMINTKETNYGLGVDIYAPLSLYYKGEINFNPKLPLFGGAVAPKSDISTIYKDDITMIASGTSFSSPIVAGVVATIMSENPDIKFTTKSMLNYLKEIGQKDVLKFIDTNNKEIKLPEGTSNVFINNGKHVIYSGNLNINNKINDEL